MTTGMTLGIANGLLVSYLTAHPTPHTKKPLLELPLDY